MVGDVPKKFMNQSHKQHLCRHRQGMDMFLSHYYGGSHVDAPCEPFLTNYVPEKHTDTVM